MDVSQRACPAGKSELSGADNIWMELPWRCSRRPTTRHWGFNECLSSEAERVKTAWLVLETKSWGAGMLEELREEQEWCKATPEVVWGLWAQRSCLEIFFCVCCLQSLRKPLAGPWEGAALECWIVADKGIHSLLQAFTEEKESFKWQE